jgi:AraC-like DNA-binding protein
VIEEVGKLIAQLNQGLASNELVLSSGWQNMGEIAVLDRTALVRQGRRLEYFTVIWNAVEGFVAVVAGLIAGSISVVGFGVDSFIEVTSGAVLLWRISRRGRRQRSTLTLIEMAQSVEFSPAHFSRMFRKSTGETLHQFVLRQRVERAKEMLRKAEMRVLDVAVACGFKTQQHFARVFRQVCGASPTEYRQEFLHHGATSPLETCSHDTVPFTGTALGERV